jgi:DNA mismatch repair protein MutL
MSRNTNGDDGPDDGKPDDETAPRDHEGRVERLPAAAVERIAAGEVVTAPADVVAELVENALDAGAERVAVAVDGGGRERVAVRDDGRGLVPGDAVRAFERHATSKLRSAADVTRVETLGFRGEALAAVAEAAGAVELTTRADGHEAVTVRVEEAVGEPEPAARGVGTTVEVRDLFADRPVRRASLASSAREFAKVSDVVSRYALVRPDVRFELTHDGREVLRTPGAGDRVEALLSVYDRDAAGAAVEFADRSGPVRVEGLACRPTVTRASREHVHVAVAGRAVRDPDLRRAVVDGYDGLLSPDRYPLAVVDVTVPPERVDVNVHPRKRSVAFADADAVREAVTTAVGEALSTADVEVVGRADLDLAGVAEPIEDGVLADAEVVGVFRELYVLCERGDELLVVDAHAADERVTYERLRDAADGVASVAVDPPAGVALSASEAALLRDEAVAAAVGRLGFGVDVRGDDTARVSGVPAPGGDTVAPAALRDVLDAVAAERPDASDPADALDLERPLVDLACHESLRAGTVTRAAAEDLLARLGGCDRPDACPHGRPTVLAVDEADLARGFDRPNTRFD